jgi:dTDP-4-dehydrorhamnose 3,5-epimerase-like enzyme
MEMKLISLPVIADARGSLGFAQQWDHVPFPVKRVFYIFDVPKGAERGGHAHKRQHQMLISVSGKWTVNGTHLNDRKWGLYLPPRTFVDMKAESENAILFVLASGIYDAQDYIFRPESGLQRA